MPSPKFHGLQCGMAIVIALLIWISFTQKNVNASPMTVTLGSGGIGTVPPRLNYVPKPSP